jgi:hypothetical protein
MPYHGYGWLCINEVTSAAWIGINPMTNELCPQTSVFVNIPYIQTVDGNMYSRTNILPELAPPSGYYNATYLILAGGAISHVTSSELYKNPSFNDSYVKPGYPTDIWLPASSTNFFSPLGYLDIPRIVKPTDNSYGMYEEHSATTLSGAYTNPNHRVIINGDLTLGEDVIPGQFTYNLVSGWQTISPVTEEMDGQLIKDVFPNTTGTVFVINNNGYIAATNFEMSRGYFLNNEINESINVNGTPINNIYYRFVGAGLHTLGAPFTMNLQGIPCISRAQRYIPGSGYVDDWNVNKGEGAWITTNSSLCQFSKNRTDVSVEFSGGATTFVVYGDLNINRNVTYDNTAISDFKDLPSVAYIVFGDVNISPEVTEVAGNFIVLGADGVNCPDIGCGIINTGSGNKFPLTVNGIMMARKFNMQRAYASVLREPSEKVIYDGRLLVNPPPGLADFAKGLPVWSETPPN